ncbi:MULTISPECIES: spore germination protein GerPB [Bacillus]|uniref:spore germination protein GerPB n=1 Tax=Bacillus TaxID=1386 RepID=UPI0002E2CD9B|nr:MULTISPECIES: spore germination protein GerPB [Bacillus]
MNFYVNQSVHIQCIKITSISNSSVFQIGSAGIIKSLSTLANTGEYTEIAPKPIGGPLVVQSKTS